MARLNICEVAPRSRTRGASTSWTRESCRRVADSHRPEAGEVTDKLRKWGDILKCDIQKVDEGRASRAPLDTHMTNCRNTRENLIQAPVAMAAPPLMHGAREDKMPTAKRMSPRGSLWWRVWGVAGARRRE